MPLTLLSITLVLLIDIAFIAVVWEIVSDTLDEKPKELPVLVDLSDSSEVVSRSSESSTAPLLS